LLALISVLLAWLLHLVSQALQLKVPWWIDPPSIMGVYGLLYSAFDRYLWQLQLLRKVGLVKVPNLKGIWEGTISSSFDKHGAQYRATVTIDQTWTAISINLETNPSRSHSLIAGIITEGSAGAVLSYEYLNEPKPVAKETMHAHRGTARLVLIGGHLEGEYYTGRDRQNYGSLSLRRAQ